MPYWQLYYHLITATKNRQPLLTPKIEPLIYTFLKQKAYDLEATVLGINGTVDHVHLVVSIPPKLAIATFMGQLKGYSATQLNQLPDHPPLNENFYWSPDYGAFTFDKKRLPNVIDYVNRQKEHHLQQTVIEALERWDDQPLRVGEEPAGYGESWLF